MSKGRSGLPTGVGGARTHLSRGQLRGTRAGGHQPAGAARDNQTRKRELLEKLRKQR